MINWENARRPRHQFTRAQQQKFQKHPSGKKRRQLELRKWAKECRELGVQLLTLYLRA